MSAQDLRTLLQQTDNIFSILNNSEIFDKYGLTTREISDLISHFLNDEEKSWVIEKSVKLGGYKLYDLVHIFGRGVFGGMEMDENTNLFRSYLTAKLR